MNLEKRILWLYVYIYVIFFFMYYCLEILKICFICEKDILVLVLDVWYNI